MELDTLIVGLIMNAVANLFITDKKMKFKWLGNFTQFESFVEDSPGVNRKWYAPGTKQIRNEDIGIRLYDTVTITLNGLKS